MKFHFVDAATRRWYSGFRTKINKKIRSFVRKRQKKCFYVEFDFDGPDDPELKGKRRKNDLRTLKNDFLQRISENVGCFSFWLKENSFVRVEIYFFFYFFFFISIFFRFWKTFDFSASCSNGRFQR